MGEGRVGVGVVGGRRWMCCGVGRVEEGAVMCSVRSCLLTTY